MPLELKIDYKGAKILFTHYCHDETGKVIDTQLEFNEKDLRKYFKDKKQRRDRDTCGLFGQV